jgi:hypothetical protein
MDTILEYLPYVVIAIVFYNIGSHVRAVQTMLNLSQDPDRFIEMVKKIKEINTEVEDNGMPEEAIPLVIEQVNGMVYAYNKITGEFIAQAQNIPQVILLAAARFPGKKFWHPELKQDTQTA